MWALHWYRSGGTTVVEGPRVYAVREPLEGCVTKTSVEGQVQKIKPVLGCLHNHTVYGQISKLTVEGVLVSHPALDGTIHGSD